MARNPMFFLFEVLLILVRRNAAGYFAPDRFVLPALGTPLEPGRVFGRAKEPGRQVA